MNKNSDALCSDLEINNLMPLNPPQAPTSKEKLSQTLEVPPFTVVKPEKTRSSFEHKVQFKVEVEGLVAKKLKPRSTPTAPRTPKLIPGRAQRQIPSDSNR